jgi:hypothetical protein
VHELGHVFGLDHCPDRKLRDVLLKLNSGHRFQGLEILRAVRVESHEGAARQRLAFGYVIFITDHISCLLKQGLYHLLGRTAQIKLQEQYRLEETN